MAKRTCTTDGCDHPCVARGLCNSCYGKAWRAGKIQPTLKLDVHSLSEVDEETRTATCSICGPTTIRLRRGRRGHECMTVRQRHAKERKRRRGYRPEERRRWTYGLSADDFARLWLAQDGDCAICKMDAPLFVDHCHRTGKVRGLLCNGCNVALGIMRDDVDRILAAADYIDRTK